MSLEQLDVVFGNLTIIEARLLDLLSLIFCAGANIGSAAIDYDFERLVRKRLEHADMTTTERHEIAWEMMKSGHFQNTKCAHGGPDDTPIFSIRIPQINQGNVNDVRGVQNGHMEFTRFVVPYPFTYSGLSN